MGRKKGFDKKNDSPYARTEASRFQHLPNPNFLTSAEPDESEPEETMDADMDTGIADASEPEETMAADMDTDIADAGFGDWMDEEDYEEEDLPLQAEAAAFPEIPVRQPGPSTSQARKGTKIGDDDDPFLCKKCLGTFKRRNHKKKDCKKHKRYSNLVGVLSPKGKDTLTAHLMADKFKGRPKDACVDLTTQFGKKMSVINVGAAGENTNIYLPTILVKP